MLNVGFFPSSASLRRGLRECVKLPPPRRLAAPAWQARRAAAIVARSRGGFDESTPTQGSATATSPRRALRPAASRPQAKRAWPTASPTPPPICSRGPSAPRYPPPLPLHSAAPVLPPRLPHKLLPSLLAYLTNSPPLFLLMIFRLIITMR